jgi:hypothetical protein
VPAPSGLSLLVATFKLMKNRNQLLLIPITIWSGLEQGFFGADFTAVICLIFYILIWEILVLMLLKHSEALCCYFLWFPKKGLYSSCKYYLSKTQNKTKQNKLLNKT